MPRRAQSIQSTAPIDIPLCAPELCGREWDYVRQCLDTNCVSSIGPFVERFERQIAEYLGVTYAVATVNGTSALHAALLLAGVRPDDEVLTASLTFIAPANAIRYVGAWPVFVDAEPRYWQMDPTRVEDFIRNECRYHNGELRNKTTSRRVSAILPVHILGHPVDMDPIVSLAREYNWAVIEDATEGLGAEYKGRKVGCLGDVACLSFNGNKIITTGGGGMIVTDDAEWAARARHLTTQAKDDPVEYIHHCVGYNYRMVNVLAAMGCAQAERLDEHIAAKRRIAGRYDAAFRHMPGVTSMPAAPWASSTFWLYTILIDPDEFGMDSRAALRSLREMGIDSRPLWQPLHLSPAHAKSPPCRGPVAERLYQQGLSLPCSVGLREEQQDAVIEAIGAQRRSPKAARAVRA
jgi:perosamine synthetase